MKPRSAMACVGGEGADEGKMVGRERGSRRARAVGVNVRQERKSHTRDSCMPMYIIIRV